MPNVSFIVLVLLLHSNKSRIRHMAYQHKTIHNTKTGQSIQFLQTAQDTNGALLEMETTYQGHSTEPMSHYHPFQVEDFTVLKGEVTVRVNGALKILQEGDTLHLPANTIHAMWNNTDQLAVVNWKVQPALNTEHLLETGMGLANDNKTNDQGTPPLLQAILTANKFSKVYRLATPSFIIQKIVFTLLTPVAYLFGYRPSYKRYLD